MSEGKGRTGVFFVKATSTNEIYTLSLHDALPICHPDEGDWASDAINIILDAIPAGPPDRKSTRLNSSHVKISYAVFCLKKKIDMAAIYAQRAYEILSSTGSGYLDSLASLVFFLLC